MAPAHGGNKKVWPLTDTDKHIFLRQELRECSQIETSAKLVVQTIGTPGIARHSGFAEVSNWIRFN
jgi:hypothetical protein